MVLVREKNAYTKSTQEHRCYCSKFVSCKKQVNSNTHLCFLFPLSLLNPKFRVQKDKKRGEYCFLTLRR